jgi:hypothetical protein
VAFASQKARATAAGLLDVHARVYLACTGAGAGLQKELWSVPGCSSFLAGATFPYAPDATIAFLGFEPERFCTPETAVDLAMASFMEAFDPREPGRTPIGLGLTASVASRHEHRGDHRIHLACMTPTKVLAQNITLPKGAGTEARARDGAAADEAALRLLLVATGLEPEGDHEDVTSLARARFFERPTFDDAGRRFATSKPPANAVLFPGAFNPPHEGHFAIARGLDENEGRRVVFAITTDPPHKPALSVAELLCRAKMLRGWARVFTQGDPLYLDKARRFPGVPFVVGADALLRMLDARWGVAVDPLLAELRSLGTRFYVVGRLVDGAFVTCEDAMRRVPEAYRDLFVGAEGRWDASSTAERERLRG